MNEQNEKNIITEEGLFYSNFSDRFQLGLATIDGSNNYSEYLVWLRDNYGIKVGKPQPQSNGQIPMDGRTVGIYIVDYQKYLSDIQEKLGKLTIDNGKRGRLKQYKCKQKQRIRKSSYHMTFGF